MIVANRLLTAIGYIAYPLLLVLLVFTDQQLLLRSILVPTCGFCLCTVLRTVINAPRPYETSDVQPMIPKTTSGKSFPSRHTFCMATIAYTWMLYQPLVGAFLLVGAVCMAVIRVKACVHHVSDVVAALILATAVCAIGYLAVPW